jgi:hypothetical protein
MRKINLKQLFAVFLVILIGVMALLSGRYWNLKKLNTNKDSQNLDLLAEQVLLKCREAKDKPSCYDREIPLLMDTISMEEAFSVTARIQSQDRSYSYCHVLGHKLSAKETRKHPDAWKDVITRCPFGMCSNGCTHGAFQERFRVEDTLTDPEIENLKGELSTVCEARGDWKPTGMEQATCYHALGHLTMYLTGADMKKAVSLCKDISRKSDGRNFENVCFDGVFMQMFQPLELYSVAYVQSVQW